MVKLLSPREAAHYSGFSYRKLVYLDEQNVLKAIKKLSGKTYRRYYTKKQLDDYLRISDSKQTYHYIKTRLSAKANQSLEDLAHQHKMPKSSMARKILESTLSGQSLDFLKTESLVPKSDAIIKKLTMIENMIIDLVDVSDDEPLDEDTEDDSIPSDPVDDNSTSEDLSSDTKKTKKKYSKEYINSRTPEQKKRDMEELRKEYFGSS